MEDQTTSEFARLARSRTRWAMPFDGQVPPLSAPVPSPAMGYVQSIDMPELQEIGAEHGIDIWLTQPIGGLVAAGGPLVHVTDRAAAGGAEAGGGGLGGPDGRIVRRIRDAVTLGDRRSIDKDPRFGLIQMSEIGSKALSPGINDPGTAIDVVTRLARILGGYAPDANPDEDVAYPNLRLAALDPDDLMEDAFDAIARDANGQTEVYLALMKVLDGLALHGPQHLRPAARRAGRMTWLRALDAVTFAPDRARLKGAAPLNFQDGDEAVRE